MNTNPKYTKSILQIVVAGYVIYLAYGLKDGIMEATGREQIFFILAAVFLCIASIAVIIMALRNMFKKDKPDEETEKTDTEEVDSTKS